VWVQAMTGKGCADLPPGKPVGPRRGGPRCVPAPNQLNREFMVDVLHTPLVAHPACIRDRFSSAAWS